MGIPANARAFANSPVATVGPGGGKFGAAQCAYDYWADAPAVVPANLTVLTTNYNGANTFYSTGNVRITGNVRPVGYPNPSWGSVGAISSYYLIVKGNIYIDPAVTDLSGVYIAIPNGPNTGRIYTCANVFSLPSPAQLADSAVGGCGHSPLTVNGAFIAQHVNFLRTKGSVRLGTPGEPYNPIGANIAEVFRFSPELFMATPNLTPVNDNGRFDSIESLPPSL